MRRKIVIADDDPTIINLVSLRLGMARFDVLPAESGPEAVRLIRCAEPAAAILDVNMPGGDGLKALGVLKADPATAKLPVMMLSGDRDPDTVMNAMGAGASDYMVKPFNPERFLERVHRLVQGSAVKWGKTAPVWGEERRAQRVSRSSELAKVTNAPSTSEGPGKQSSAMWEL